MVYTKQAKKHIKLGVVSMAGLGAVGALGAVPGMPAAAGGVAGTVGAGLALTNVGQLAETGMVITGSMGQKPKKKTGNKVVDNILG